MFPVLPSFSERKGDVSIYPQPLDPVTQRRDRLTMLVLTEKKIFLRLASSILHSSADAEDAVHTAFCSAWKAIGDFRGESSLKTWFSRIVFNTALIELRKRRCHQTVFLEDHPEYLHDFELHTSPMIEDPERVAVRREALQMIQHQLKSLPAETRTIVTMHFIGDYSIDAIVKLRKRSRSSVVSHLHRGKVLLRKRIKQRYPSRSFRTTARPC